MNFQKYYLANLTLSAVDQGNSPTLSPSINTRGNISLREGSSVPQERPSQKACGLSVFHRQKPLSKFDAAFRSKWSHLFCPRFRGPSLAGLTVRGQTTTKPGWLHFGKTPSGLPGLAFRQTGLTWSWWVTRVWFQSSSCHRLSLCDWSSWRR